MREFVKGMLARSKAGHDTGKLYVVMYADTEYVYLTDGIHRTLDKMKKKKRKHIQEMIKDGKEMQNEHIKKAIKDYESNQQEV